MAVFLNSAHFKVLGPWSVCGWERSGGGQDGENLFKQEEADRQSVDCASSCPAHGRIELKMMSLIFSWQNIIKTGAGVCHPNSVLKSVTSQILDGNTNSSKIHLMIVVS